MISPQGKVVECRFREPDRYNPACRCESRRNHGRAIGFCPYHGLRIGRMTCRHWEVGDVALVGQG